jgi:hypothetical protein
MLVSSMPTSIAVNQRTRPYPPSPVPMASARPARDQPHLPASAEIPELVIGHVANPAANPLGVAVDRLLITPSSLWELMQPELTQ